MQAAIRFLRSLFFGIGVLLIALGVVAAAYGAIRMSFFVETTGFVTEGLPLTHSASRDLREMFYRYAVDGRSYSGAAILPLTALQDKAGQPNRAIRVFYQRWHPANSYAVYRPNLLRRLQVSAVIALIGVLAIILPWKAQRLTSRRCIQPLADVSSRFPWIPPPFPPPGTPSSAVPDPALVRPVMPQRTRFDSFLPRSDSAFVFTLAFACYDWAFTAFFGAIVRMLHFPPRPLSFWETHGDPAAHALETLVFAPLIETAIFIAMIELLRWVRMPVTAQIFITSVLVGFAHSYSWAWPPYGFIVTPSFLIQGAAYLYWRRVSIGRGFAVVASIHALHNLVPAMHAFAHATSTLTNQSS